MLVTVKCPPPGSFLPVPALPLAGPVKVQVIKTGVCLGSDFSPATSNTATKYQAQTP